MFASFVVRNMLQSKNNLDQHWNKINMYFYLKLGSSKRYYLPHCNIIELAILKIGRRQIVGVWNRSETCLRRNRHCLVKRNREKLTNIWHMKLDIYRHCDYIKVLFCILAHVVLCCLHWMLSKDDEHITKPWRSNY